MELHDQCCTREQGQRLVELGVKPEALFWWMPSMSGPHGEYIRYSWHGNNLAPAFNAAELGELLPATEFLKHQRTDQPLWEVTCIEGNGPKKYWHAENSIDCIGPYPTEAQARAALLIHLLENNGVPCRHCQQRYTGAVCENLNCPGPKLKYPDSENRKMTVTVDLNATRVRLAEAYNAVTTALNEQTKNNGWINVYVGELQEPMEDIRRNTAILCHTYFKDNEEYASIGEQVPEFIDFNPNNY